MGISTQVQKLLHGCLSIWQADICSIIILNDHTARYAGSVQLSDVLDQDSTLEGGSIIIATNFVARSCRSFASLWSSLVKIMRVSG